MGNFCIIKGAEPSVCDDQKYRMRDLEWKEGLRGRGYIYKYIHIHTDN